MDKLGAIDNFFVERAFDFDFKGRQQPAVHAEGEVLQPPQPLHVLRCSGMANPEGLGEACNQQLEKALAGLRAAPCNTARSGSW